MHTQAQSVKRMQSRSLTLTLAVASVLLAAATARAQEAATPNLSEWACSKCPFERGYDADVKAGLGYVDDSSAKFGDYRGLDEEGGVLILDAEGRASLESGYALEYELLDLGTDAREAQIGGGKQGEYEFSLFYDRIPHTIFDTAETVFEGLGSRSLTLPSGWVRAGSTLGMTALDDSLREVDVGLDRDRYGAGGRVWLGEAFSVSLDYRRDERDGTRVQPFAFGSVSSELLRPVDDATDRFDAAVRWERGTFYAEASYYLSLYDTEAASLRWQNPFTPMVAGGDVGQAALAPDNDYQEFALAVGWHGLPLNTAIGLSAAKGSGSQDIGFLPYTVNPRLSTDPLPMANLDGSVDVTRADLTISMTPLDRLRMRGAATWDERDNDSRQAAFTSVVHTDLFPVVDDRTNPVYGYERVRLRGSADFDVYSDLTVGVGGVYATLDRKGTDQEGESEELTDGWGWAQYRPSGYLGFVVKGGVEERDPDPYRVDVGTANGQNALMRKYNQAYRYRAYFDFLTSVSFGSLPLTLGIDAFYADDSYNDSEIGLVAGIDRRYTVDLTWAVDEATSLYVTAGREKIDSKRKGSSVFGEPDWRGDVEDDYVTYGAGLHREFAENLELDVSYTWAEGDSDTVVHGVAAGAFPTAHSRLSSLRLDFTYPLTGRADFVFSWWHESFESTDWAIEGIEPDTLPTVLALGVDPYDYSVNYIGASLRYSFGSRAATPEE